MNYRQLYANNKEPDSGLINDQAVKLNNYNASLDYTLIIRRIKFKDSDTGKNLVFLTNHFDLRLIEIAQFY
jgi:hypothetical protein